MKRKELQKYIREQIISELSIEEESVAWNSSTKSQAKTHIDKSKLSSDAKKQAKDEIDQNASGLISNVTETDLEEMALEGSGARYTAGSKFEEAKEIYTTGLFAELLKAIEEAGEKGLTQKELGSILNRGDGSSLNLILKNLRGIGVLVNSKLAAKAAKASQPKEEPEDIDIEEPETEEDEWESAAEEPETEEEPEEEETPEEEPVATTKASDDLGKWADELAKLNTKKDDLVKKLKAKEITMDQYKEMIGNIPTQIKALQAKIDRYSE